MKRILVIIVFIVCSAVMLNRVFASEMSVPKYLNYQGILFDGEGVPLGDGTLQVIFRILDSETKPLYEEIQDIDVISGVVSVIIGTGLDITNSLPTGGISNDVLLPNGPKYLEVQVEGYSPERLMEIVSVPYANYSNFALRVAEASVGSENIKEKSIQSKHLSDEAITQLASSIGDAENSPVIVREEFDSFKTSLSGEEGAKQIGVKSDFTYSSSDNLEGTLKDFDLAIRMREEKVKVMDQSIGDTFDNLDQTYLPRDGSQTMIGTLNLESGGKQLSSGNWNINSSGDISTNGSITLNNGDNDIYLRPGRTLTDGQGNTTIGRAYARIDGDLTVQDDLTVRDDLSVLGKISVNETLGQGATPLASTIYRNSIVTAWGFVLPGEGGVYSLGSGFNVRITNNYYRCTQKAQYDGLQTCSSDYLDRLGCDEYVSENAGDGRFCVLFNRQMNNNYYASTVTAYAFDCSYSNYSTWGRSRDGFGIYVDNDGGGGVNVPVSFMVVGGN